MMRPPPLLLHVAHGVLDGRVDGGEVDLDHLVPVVIVEHVDGALRVAVPLGRQEPGPCVDAGIGEDHVDPPMPVRHGVERRCHPAAIGHVQGLAPDIAAAGHHLGNDRFETFCVYVEDADARAVVRHHLGIGASDAARTAGHDDRLASDIEHLMQRRHASSLLRHLSSLTSRPDRRLCSRRMSACCSSQRASPPKLAATRVRQSLSNRQHRRQRIRPFA